MARREFRNQLSYSASKHKMLDACPRRLFYYAYASWGGWWRGKSPPKDRKSGDVYAAKHYETRFSWAGKVVHRQAEWALKTAMEGRKWTRETLRNRMLERASSEITNGLKQAREQRATNPKYTLRLLEIETGEGVDEEFIRDRVRGRILALTSVDDAWTGLSRNVNLFMRAMNARHKIVSVEDLMSHKVHGVTTWLACDLIMRSSRDPMRRCVIVDWKTGIPRDRDSDQIGQYGLWATSRGWSDAEMILVYLGDGTTKCVHKKIDSSTMDAARSRVKEYANQMRTMLADGDLDRNDPIESKFKPTTDPSRCQSCSFQIVCERDGTKPEGVDHG